MKTILVSPKVCYVCNKNIKSGEEIYIGQGNYRHTHCAPGTARWLNSPHLRSSPYKDLWGGILTDTSGAGEAASARFRGELFKRIKYVKPNPKQMTLF